jgi:hypothetical protein
MRYVKLTDQQFTTIEAALKFDYKNAKTLGALPIGVELQEEIEDAYKAIQQNSGLFNEEDMAAVVATVVARCRGTMAEVIGDRTPRQYDRADKMAEGIASAVRIALAEIGLYDPEEVNAEVG